MSDTLFNHPQLYALAVDDAGRITHASPRCAQEGLHVGTELHATIGEQGARDLLEKSRNGSAEGLVTRLENGHSFRWIGGLQNDSHLFTLSPAEEVERLAIVEKLLDESKVLLFAADADGKLRFALGGSEQAKAIEDQSTFNVLEANKDTPTEACIRLALEGAPTELMIEPLPGKYYDDRYAPVLDHAGNIVGVCGFAIDVSDRVHGELRLRDTVERLERQSAALRALSTPIIRVWDEIICLPIVGVVDSQRTADMMESLLTSITEEKARYAIIDLTGVEVVDTSTAEHLLRLFRAAAILGVEGVLCGIRPAVAQTIVTLGVDLAAIHTVRTLEEALRYSFSRRVAQRKKQLGREVSA